MRPIKLIFRGLNSFSEEQIIDFEKLTEAGLFGIFGPTGSGKSTIIDACTMALYSEMSRQSGRECINQDCDEMYVGLEFEVNNELYKVERAYTGDSKGLKQKRARLYLKGGDSPKIISDKPKEITACVTELIGLKYSDFSRSVILPQGRFSEFLMLGERDRSDMLERIFGLEEFGDKFMKRLKSIRRDYEGRLALAENSLSAYEGVSADALLNAENELKKDLLRLSELKEALSVIRTELEAKKRLKGFVNEYITYERRLTQCLEESGRIDEKRVRAETAAKAMAVKPFITAADKTAAQISGLKEELERNSAELSQAEHKLEEARGNAENAANKKDTELPGLIETEAKLGRALEIEKESEQLNKEREDLLKEYRKCEKNRNRFANERENKIKSCESSRKELEALAIRKTEIAISPERRLDITEAFGVSKELKRISSGLDVMRKKQKKLLADSERSARETESICREAELAAKEKSELTNKIEELKARKPEPKEIHELRAALQENLPCPVCGSVSHPFAQGADVTSDMNKDDWERDLSLAEKKLAECAERLEQLNLKKAVLSGKAEGIGAQLKEIDTECDAAERELGGLEEKFRLFCQRLGTDDVESLYAMSSAQDREAAEMAKRENELRSLTEVLTAETDKLAADVNALEAELQKIQVIGSEKSGQIQRLNAQLNDIAGEKKPSEYLAEIRARIAELYKNADTAKVVLAEITESLRLRKEQTESGLARLAALDDIHAAESRKITELLAEQGLPNRDAVTSGWLEKSQADELNREIKEFDERVKDLSGNMERTRNLTAGLLAEQDDGNDAEGEPFNARVITIDHRLLSETESVINALEERHTAATDELDQRTGAAAVGKRHTEQMREDLVKVDTLQKQKNDLTHKLDILSDLDSLFRGNEFVKYISKQHLRGITREASRRMKDMTSGRYAIESDNTDFVIRDDFNGGSRRSPRTLSGGETFMVSLCLALALSSRLQQKNRTALEFFFLDEGFGTLDSKILDTVMNCLERLRGEKMSVGIISHVEELKSRVPKKLSVICDPYKGGSRVEQ